MSQKEALEKPRAVIPMFELRHRGGGTYDVFSVRTGKPVNSEPLSRKDAVDLHRELDAALRLELERQHEARKGQ